MPRIPESFVDSVVYLFGSVEAAERSDPIGGCGVLVGVAFEKYPELCHVYVVTNAHVSDIDRVIRYNTRQGLRSRDLTVGNWFSHPDGWDVSVCPVGLNLFYDDRLSMIRADILITREQVEEIPLRHGDELFMVSRYVGHPGSDDNEPVVRFGTLAKRRPVIVALENDNDQESFLAEMRSLPGHSGSPTFVYFYGMQPRLGADDVDKLPRAAIYLLGVDWGHLPEVRPVFQDGANGRLEETPDLFVEDNSGMMCIVPAWRIIEILDRDELKSERKREENLW
jgi:hypothetical protein